MNKKEMICFVMMFVGSAIMAISYLDILSIISNVLNKIFNLNLPDVWFNSFLFRGIAALFGGMFLLSGGFIYKKNRNE